MSRSRLFLTPFPFLLWLMSGCASNALAPDAFSNVKATGFNAYLNQIGADCAPLMLGGQSMSEAIRFGSISDTYGNFLDSTSKLYYRRISPTQYRADIDGFFSGGNDAAVDCVIARLPPA